MDSNIKIVRISHNKSIKQNIGICNICYIEKFLSKCKRCTLVICNDCIKKYNKNHCPVCKLYPRLYEWDYVTYDHQKEELLLRKKLQIEYNIKELKKIYFMKWKIIMWKKNRKFLDNICEFTIIKEKYSNFNIKLITGIINTNYMT